MSQIQQNLPSTKDSHINYTKYSHRFQCMSYIQKSPTQVLFTFNSYQILIQIFTPKSYSLFISSHELLYKQYAQQSRTLNYNRSQFKICVMSNVSSHMLTYNGSSSSNSQNMHRSKSSLQPMSFFLNQSQISHVQLCHIHYLSQTFQRSCVNLL